MPRLSTDRIRRPLLLAVVNLADFPDAYTMKTNAKGWLETLVLDDEGNRTTLIRLQLYLYQNSYTHNLIMDTLSGRGQDPPPGGRDQGAPGVYERWSWCQEIWDPDTWENVGKTMDHRSRSSASRAAAVILGSPRHFWMKVE